MPESIGPGGLPDAPSIYRPRPPDRGAVGRVVFAFIICMVVLGLGVSALSAVAFRRVVRGSDQPVQEASWKLVHSADAQRNLELATLDLARIAADLSERDDETRHELLDSAVFRLTNASRDYAESQRSLGPEREQGTQDVSRACAAFVALSLRAAGTPSVPAPHETLSASAPELTSRTHAASQVVSAADAILSPVLARARSDAMQLADAAERARQTRSSDLDLARTSLAIGLALVSAGAAGGILLLARQRSSAAASGQLSGQANAAETVFVTNMNHELRTPLGAVLGYAELLAGDLELAGDNSKRRQWVAGIQRNGQHVLSVVTDLLDLSRIEAGTVKLTREPTSPAAIVDDVLSMFRVRALTSGLTLDAQIDAAVPSQIVSDPLHLRQILLTLVGNAIKFTERGGVSIRVAAIQSPAPALRFEVQDTGIGIAAEIIPNLFQPFTQADSSATRRYEGLGLGLAIAQNLARMLGGEITVRSEPERGSMFALTIAAGTPVVAPSQPGIPATTVGAPPIPAEVKSTPQNEPTTPLTLHGFRILVAEDGRENQYLIAHHLTKAGATVTVVENGRLAIEAISTPVQAGHFAEAHPSPPFDLILMDMQMPEMDGYSAARILRDRGCRLPIIALTAHAMAADRDKCLAAGCTDYTTKPFDGTTLVSVCRRGLEFAS